MRPADTHKKRTVVDFLLLKVNTNDTSLNTTCKNSRTVASMVLVPKLYFSSDYEINFKCQSGGSVIHCAY